MKKGLSEIGTRVLISDRPFYEKPCREPKKTMVTGFLE